MANVKIRHLSKDQTWHTANATWVVEQGRIVILTGANPMLFKIGDGTTQLQNLEWSNGTKTLAQILLAGNKTGGTKLQSDNTKSQLKLNDTESSLNHLDGVDGGGIANNSTKTRINHSALIELDATNIRLMQSYLYSPQTHPTSFSTLQMTDTQSAFSNYDGIVSTGIVNNNTKHESLFYNGAVYAYLRHESTKSSLVHPTQIEFTSASVTKNGYAIATENFVDQRVQSNIKIVGDWDATSGSYPLADESNVTPFIAQWGATIKQGWAWRVGYGQAGTVGGYDYEEGDAIYALVDNPTNSQADWGDLDHNLQQANESLRGTAKITTNAIIDDETTTDDERVVSSKKFWRGISRLLAIANTWSLKQTFTTAPRLSSNSASTPLAVDSNKDVSDLTDSIWGSWMNGLTAKTTPVDTDGVTIKDTADSNKAKFLSFTNLKAFLKTYFDTQYQSGLLFKQNITINHTGTITPTIIASFPIPLNFNQANDFVKIWGMAGVDVSGGAVGNNQIRFYIGPNPTDLIGSIHIATMNNTTTLRTYPIGRTMVFKNSLTDFELSATQADFVQSDYATNANAPTLYSIDFTTQKYFHVVGILTNTGNIISIRSLYAQLMR